MLFPGAGWLVLAKGAGLCSRPRACASGLKLFCGAAPMPPWTAIGLIVCAHERCCGVSSIPDSGRWFTVNLRKLLLLSRRRGREIGGTEYSQRTATIKNNHTSAPIKSFLPTKLSVSISRIIFRRSTVMTRSASSGDSLCRNLEAKSWPKSFSQIC